MNGAQFKKQQADSQALTENPAIDMAEIRDLSLDEIGELSSASGEKKALQKVRSIHHKAAQLIAAGASNNEVAAATGMNATTISVYKNDPAFSELVSFYMEEETERWRDVRERAADVGMLGMEVLQDRLLEQPEAVKTKDLVEIMTSGLEYGGFGPVKKSASVGVAVSKEEMDEIRRNADENVSVRTSEESDVDGDADVVDAEWSERGEQED